MSRTKAETEDAPHPESLHPPGLPPLQIPSGGSQ
jgi:hypothetical protein